MRIDDSVKYEPDGTPYIVIPICGYMSKVHGVIHKCDGCGKDAFFRRDQMKNCKHHYCDMDCRNKYWTHPFIGRHHSGESKAKMSSSAKERIKKYGLNNPKRGKDINCPICGKKFYARNNRLKRSKIVTCSKTCHNKWLSTLPSETNPNWKGGKPILKCHICGKEFKATYSSGKRESKRFCSRECLLKWRCSLTGPMAHGWRGGLRRQLYTTEFNNAAFRDAIRKRDGYRCVNCGKTEAENGKKLDVHHIDYNKKNTSQFNLVASCHSCNQHFNGNRAYWQKHLSAQMYWFRVSSGWQGAYEQAPRYVKA